MTEKHVLNWWTIGKSSINIPIQRREINRDTPFLSCPAKWCIHPKSFWIQISLWETYGSQHIVRTYVTYLKNTMFDSWNWNDAVGLFNGGWSAPNITITGGTIMIQPEFCNFFLHQGIEGFLYIKKNCRESYGQVRFADICLFQAKCGSSEANIMGLHFPCCFTYSTASNSQQMLKWSNCRTLSNSTVLGGCYIPYNIIDQSYLYGRFLK